MVLDGFASGPMHPAIPAAAPFSFQKRRGKLDWRKMAKIDLDRVSREVRPTRQACRAETTLSTAVRATAGGH